MDFGLSPCMNRRKARVMRLNRSLAIVLPKDWVRGMDIRAGSLVEIVYNGVVKVKPVRGDGGGEMER